MSDYNDYPTLEERMERAMPFRHEPPEPKSITTYKERLWKQDPDNPSGIITGSGDKINIDPNQPNKEE